GQKYFAFQERNPVRGGQVALFVAVQVVGLAINALLYDAVLRLVPGAASLYVAARLVTTNIVWLGYSFPVWHLVFRAR
ncbi:MAG TPA: hypothetical protein VNO21_16320, partial [Polyangiaceae bacterium]|nr:hypothetical protein [Polyangiaceae bacterium]